MLMQLPSRAMLFQVDIFPFTNIQPVFQNHIFVSKPCLSTGFGDAKRSSEIRAFAPVEEWLVDLTMEPTVVVVVQIVPIPMSRIDLIIRHEMKSQFSLHISIMKILLRDQCLKHVPPQANAVEQVSGPSHLWTDLCQPKVIATLHLCQ